MERFFVQSKPSTTTAEAAHRKKREKNCQQTVSPNPNPSIQFCDMSGLNGCVAALMKPKLMKFQINC